MRSKIHKHIRYRAVASLTLVCCLLIFTPSRSQNSDPGIPPVMFGSHQINLNLPEYRKLRFDGGWMYIQSLDGVPIGVRGIILYRKSESEYLVFDRNCSYHSNDECATINVDPSNLFLIDPCCNSMFSFSTGDATRGPASRPLRQYEATLMESILTISDEIIR